jgi:hypothetical protein
MCLQIFAYVALLLVVFTMQSVVRCNGKPRKELAPALALSKE